MNCYDWDKNLLYFEDKNGNIFNLQLRGPATIIDGKSGTGKSLIVSKIQSFMRDYNDSSLGYSTDNIIILDKYNKNSIFNETGKLIIIDRGEVLVDQKIVDFVNGDMERNRFLIFMREAVGFSISPNYHGRLVQEGKEIKIHYRYNIPGWF